MRMLVNCSGLTDKLMFMGDAISAFSRKSLAKSFPKDRWKSSHFGFKNGENLSQSASSIVLRVLSKFFITKEFQLYLQHDSRYASIKIDIVL